MTVEYRAVGYRRSPFPPSWGTPVGETYSEERAAWVEARVRAQMRYKPLQQLVRRRLEMYVSEKQTNG